MKSKAVIVAMSLSLVTLPSCDKTATVGGEGTSPSATVTASDQQLVAITVGEEGFVPNLVEFKRGSKATLRFTRTTERTCATTVVFPELGLNKPLPLNQAIDIEIPTEQGRTLTFQCGMGMYQSKVVVR